MRRLEINSLDELMKHEAEILTRIAATPNGGNLFLIHPFLLLDDIGIELTARAEQEIVDEQPSLAGLSPIPYNNLKASRLPQRVTVSVRGLFQRRAR